MAKGHRSQIKRARNANKDTRPSAKLSYARMSAQKAGFVLDAIRGSCYELTEFVSNHILCNVYRHMFSSVMNSDCVSNE